MTKFLNGKEDLNALVTIAPDYPFVEIISTRLGLHDHDTAVQNLRNYFDLVIVDAPAIEHDQDRSGCCRNATPSSSSLRPNRTKAKDLADAMDLLDVNHAPVRGSILNFSA